MSRGRRPPGANPVLRGRRSECHALDRLLDGAREGRSGALVVRGESGIGKTALLRYAGERASGCGDARALLASVVSGRLDAQVSERIVAETGGNPLALLELPRGFTAAELAGGFGPPGAAGLSGRIEESFLRRIERLPADTRMLLLV